MSIYIKKDELLKVLNELPLNTELPKIIKLVEKFKTSKVEDMFDKHYKDLTESEKYRYRVALGMRVPKWTYKLQGRVENSLCWQLFGKHYRELTKAEQTKYRAVKRKIEKGKQDVSSSNQEKNE